MNLITSQKLQDAGWTVECESPLEIRHTDGSFATGQAGQLLLAEFSEKVFEPVSWKPVDLDVRQHFRDFKVDEVAQLKGAAKFAVRSGCTCLNKEGEMEYEPIPSSRDDEFIARCRFDTLAEAFDAAKAFLKLQPQVKFQREA